MVDPKYVRFRPIGIIILIPVHTTICNRLNRKWEKQIQIFYFSILQILNFWIIYFSFDRWTTGCHVQRCPKAVYCSTDDVDVDKCRDLPVGTSTVTPLRVFFVFSFVIWWWKLSLFHSSAPINYYFDYLFYFKENNFCTILMICSVFPNVVAFTIDCSYFM
jgi:hypothetical protein